MNIIMPYEELERIVIYKGWNGLLNYLRNKFPKLNLYDVSMDWFNNRSYICKAKGSDGDIIISWQ